MAILAFFVIQILRYGSARIWLIALMLSPWRRVLGGCEPRQAFFVDVDFQGVDACDCHVDAEVELQAVDEEGVRDVMAGDHCGIVIA